VQPPGASKINSVSPRPDQKVSIALEVIYESVNQVRQFGVCEQGGVFVGQVRDCGIALFEDRIHQSTLESSLGETLRKSGRMCPGNARCLNALLALFFWNLKRQGE
jgi:hypothetical protein